MNDYDFNGNDKKRNLEEEVEFLESHITMLTDEIDEIKAQNVRQTQMIVKKVESLELEIKSRDEEIAEAKKQGGLALTVSAVASAIVLVVVIVVNLIG
ncbi:MAG: hypothetical protein FWB74_04025 [Defluviitaleaceae bacterium]|nr:hypothetical protein [Defluviitaleaceae bacterium]